MTNEEAITILESAIAHNEIEDVNSAYAYMTALDIAIKALEQEPCEDCISREAAIYLADELKDNLPEDERLSDLVMSHNEGILEYQTQLSLLPSVHPKQRTGYWIKNAEEYQRVDPPYLCSECGNASLFEEPFCCKCGEKMEVKDDK